MTSTGIIRGRRKSLACVRAKHLGTGNCQLYKDGVLQGTFACNTTTWLELFASAPEKTNYIEIFDSTGEVMVLGLGASGSETFYLQILPGGNEHIPVRIDPGSRISLKAFDVVPEIETETTINFYD